MIFNGHPTRWNHVARESRIDVILAFDESIPADWGEEASAEREEQRGEDGSDCVERAQIAVPHERRVVETMGGRRKLIAAPCRSKTKQQTRALPVQTKRSGGGGSSRVDRHCCRCSRSEAAHRRCCWFVSEGSLERGMDCCERNECHRARV